MLSSREEACDPLCNALAGSPAREYSALAEVRICAVTPTRLNSLALPYGFAGVEEVRPTLPVLASSIDT
jgi:hypothetical protein